jgi:hypothetical protein
MPRIPRIDRKKAYGKTKSVAGKFEVAAVGNLAGSRTARMVEKLSWLLHHPDLPPMFEEEWARFSEKARTAIADGDAEFFSACAAMVSLIRDRMSKISVDDRIALSEISKTPPSVRRLIHWNMGNQVDELGKALLSTLTRLARFSDNAAKFSQPQVMEALARFYPEHADCDEKHVREVLKLMKIGGFPINAAPFKGLFRVPSKSRKKKTKKQ